MASNIAISMVHGEDKTFPFAIKQSDGVTAQDITGWDLLLTIIVGATRFTYAPTITNAVSGLCAITIARTDSVAWPARAYALDLWRTDTGENAELGTGTLTVAPAVRANS